MAKFVYDGWDFPSVKAGPPNERFLKMIMSPEIGNYQGASFLFSHIPPGSGTGAVTGSKKLKAVAVTHGKRAVEVHDAEKLSVAAREIIEGIKSSPY